MFRESFKYYKSKKDPPDLQTVIDLDRPDIEETSPAVLRRLPIAAAQRIGSPPASPARRRPDCRPAAEWRVYELCTQPGLLLVRNMFTGHGQRYWMARCLRDYPRAPHAETNLPPPSQQADEKHSDATTAAAAARRDWWHTLQSMRSARGDDAAALRLRNAMRWATLGYQHNWDTKRYSERRRQPFPGDLAALAAHVVHTVLGDAVGYAAQAAIVNFYPLGSTLAGHTDHSERDLEAPLLSFSFGQTAIFLIGGRTVDVRPAAVFLRSGDIAIMSRHSRLSYHAVPRVMHEPEAAQRWQRLQRQPDAGPPAKRARTAEEATANCVANGAEREDDEQLVDAALWRSVADENDWRPFGEYAAECRININVRQVLPSGVDALESDNEDDVDDDEGGEVAKIKT